MPSKRFVLRYGFCTQNNKISKFMEKISVMLPKTLIGFYCVKKEVPKIHLTKLRF